MNGPMPTISIILMAVACVSDNPLSNSDGRDPVCSCNGLVYPAKITKATSFPMDIAYEGILNLSDEFIVFGRLNGICFRMYIQLVIDVLYMRLYCFQVYEQFLGYALTALAGGYLLQDLCFAARKR